MKVSLNHIKSYIDFELPPVDDLVDRINRQLGGVEEVIDLSARYSEARIVVIASARQHPDADRLSICLIDDGGNVDGVPRDEDGLIQVVCGAPNVRGGMSAVWLPPQSIVPASAADDEPFKLSARELRGVLSQGMLAAPDELAIGEGHDGILEITEYDLPAGLSLDDNLIGRRFSEVFGLDDTIIEIENKMFTHRPDLFGQLGVAREISAILGGITADEEASNVQFENPDQYWKIPEFKTANGLDLDVFNQAADLVPRIMFVAMENVKVGPSPLWLQCALVAMGSKPINNIVDASNYIMLQTAQPTHAYDYDKIRGHEIGARLAADGEKIKLLNGKEYNLTSNDIVIADEAGPVGLGGVMGGSDSEVDENTTSIILEVATFDMYAVRKSAMRHGVFTDALTRFNKGQSPLQNGRITSMLIDKISSLSGATQASNVYDEPSGKWDDVESVHRPITTSPDFITERLGIDISASQISNLLERVNITSSPDETDAKKLVFTAPFWRTDIELPEDIVEEVGRLYDFGKLPRELPTRTISPTIQNPMIVLKRNIRQILSGAGANEVLTYSFIHSKLIEQSGQSVERAYQLSNALSPDLHYLRLSLQPSLLDKVYSNIRDGYDEFSLFEIGSSHDKSNVGQDKLPHESDRLAAVYTNKHKPTSSPYYSAKRTLDYLADEINLTIGYLKADLDDDQIGTMFEPKRRATIVNKKTGQQIGVIGEYTAKAKQAYKLPEASAGFEIKLGDIADSLSPTGGYQPLSRYPSAERDVCFKLPGDVEYQTLVDEIESRIGQPAVRYDISPVDIYQANNEPTKNITVRIKLTPLENTLSGPEIDQIVNSASIQVCQKLDGEIV